MIQKAPQVDWKEIRIVSGIILLTTLVASMNYLIAAVQTGSDAIFSGLVTTSRIDMSVYYSLIEYARQGHILSPNLFTAESTLGGLLHPLWLVIGTAARWFQLSSIEAFHWARLFTGVLWLFGVYACTFLVFKKSLWRVLSVVSVTWLSGWGYIIAWLQEIVEPSWIRTYHLVYPADLWLNEGFGFLTLYHSPLYLVTQLLLVLAWLSLLWRKAWMSWVTGVLMGLLGLMHPYDIPVFWVVVVAWFAVEYIFTKQPIKPWIKKLLPSIVATVGLLVYYAWFIVMDRTINGWLDQNITLPPSFFALLTGYGWLWLFAGIGLWWMIHEYSGTHEKRYSLAIVWFLSLPLLMYVPIQISRRFIHTFGIIVGIMAIAGVRWMWLQYGRSWWYGEYSWRHIVGIAAAVFIILTAIYGPIYHALFSSYESYFKVQPSYLPASVQEIGVALRAFDDTDVILTNDMLGNILPGISGRTVYLGHSHQTINFDEKERLVLRFYTTQSLEWRKTFVASQNIAAVVWPLTRVAEFEGIWPIVFENENFVIFDIR